MPKTLNTHLEGHVLQKVSSTIGLFRLEPRSSINPYSNSGRLVVGVGLGGDGKTVGQLCDFCFRNVAEGLRVGVFQGPCGRVGFGKCCTSCAAGGLSVISTEL